MHFTGLVAARRARLTHPGSVRPSPASVAKAAERFSELHMRGMRQDRGIEVDEKYEQRIDKLLGQAPEEPLRGRRESLLPLEHVPQHLGGDSVDMHLLLVGDPQPWRSLTTKRKPTKPVVPPPSSARLKAAEASEPPEDTERLAALASPPSESFPPLSHAELRERLKTLAEAARQYRTRDLASDNWLYGLPPAELIALLYVTPAPVSLFRSVPNPLALLLSPPDLKEQSQHWVRILEGAWSILFMERTNIFTK